MIALIVSWNASLSCELMFYPSTFLPVPLHATMIYVTFLPRDKKGSRFKDDRCMNGSHNSSLCRISHIQNPNVYYFLTTITWFCFWGIINTICFSFFRMKREHVIYGFFRWKHKFKSLYNIPINYNLSIHSISTVISHFTSSLGLSSPPLNRGILL